MTLIKFNKHLIFLQLIMVSENAYTISYSKEDSQDEITLESSDIGLKKAEEIENGYTEKKLIKRTKSFNIPASTLVDVSINSKKV